MDVDGLTGELESVLQRSRAGLNQEVERARNALHVARAETGKAQTALSELREQRDKAQADLDAVLKHLDRASNLAGLDAETKKARKELEAVKAETEKATTAVQVLQKQKADLERQHATATYEISALAATRTQLVSEIDRLKKLLAA